MPALKRTLVCFSGGLDSTALLLNQIVNHSDLTDTCFFIIESNEKQQSLELKNRKKILKEIKKALAKENNGFRGMLGEDKVYDFIKDRYLHNNYYAHQALLWVLYLVTVVDLSKYDEVVLGYVRQDDFWHFRHKVDELYESFKNLSLTPEKFPVLKYPFEWETKKDISCWFDTEKHFSHAAKSHIDKIAKLVTSCEEPKEDGTACGECPSCERDADINKEKSSVIESKETDTAKDKAISEV